ncbi:hypothetical protein AAG906_033130 [Vitis piasezkii]
MLSPGTFRGSSNFHANQGGLRGRSFGGSGRGRGEYAIIGFIHHFRVNFLFKDLTLVFRPTAPIAAMLATPESVYDSNRYPDSRLFMDNGTGFQAGSNGREDLSLVCKRLMIPMSRFLQSNHNLIPLEVLSIVNNVQVANSCSDSCNSLTSSPNPSNVDLWHSILDKSSALSVPTNVQIVDILQNTLVPSSHSENSTFDAVTTDISVANQSLQIIPGTLML